MKYSFYYNYLLENKVSIYIRNLRISIKQKVLLIYSQLMLLKCIILMFGLL